MLFVDCLVLFVVSFKVFVVRCSACFVFWCVLSVEVFGFVG